MKIKHQLSIATLVMAGVFATGCSQQVAGGSQASGGSQVSGGSQQQVEGGSQVSGGSQQSSGGSQVADDSAAAGGSQQSGSQQQVEDTPVVAPVAKAAPRRAVPRPAPRKVAPRRAGNCHGHAANARTKSMRHCHPNPTASHRYGGQRRAVHRGGNRWTHTHPAVPRCTKSIRHTHKYKNIRHSHKYSCQGMRRAAPRRAAAPAPRKQPVDVYALQRKLKAKGYYKGPIDGIVGSGTRSALKRFMNR